MFFILKTLFYEKKKKIVKKTRYFLNPIMLKRDFSA